MNTCTIGTEIASGIRYEANAILNELKERKREGTLDNHTRYRLLEELITPGLRNLSIYPQYTKFNSPW